MARWTVKRKQVKKPLLGFRFLLIAQIAKWRLCPALWRLALQPFFALVALFAGVFSPSPVVWPTSVQDLVGHGQSDLFFCQEFIGVCPDLVRAKGASK